jgi:hypothetical protein
MSLNCSIISGGNILRLRRTLYKLPVRIDEVAGVDC